MNPTPDTSLVSAEWLSGQLDNPLLRVVDASWHLPAAGRDAAKEFKAERVPGAVFFDIDEHSAVSSLPHMLPGAEQFAQAVGDMGIASDHKIVVYDTLGIFSAARVWWMFRHFGAADVSVLDGGLPAWRRAGHEVVSDATTNTNNGSSGSRYAACEFVVNTTQLQRHGEVVDASAVLSAIDRDGDAVVDVRGAGRFSGEDKEARAGLRSGHIPGSINLPFAQLFNDQGLMKSAAELTALFDSFQLPANRQIISTCGSGVTATILILALERAGYANAILYDGSWSEWGALQNMPVVSGE